VEFKTELQLVLEETLVLLKDQSIQFHFFAGQVEILVTSEDKEIKPILNILSKIRTLADIQTNAATRLKLIMDGHGKFK
jgi:hypothetical protein